MINIKHKGINFNKNGNVIYYNDKKVMKINNITPNTFLTTKKHESINSITVFIEETGELQNIIIKKITTPKRNTITPKSNTTTPKRNTITPKRNTITPKSNTTTPKRNTTTPKRNTTTPKRNTTTPKRNTTTPKRNSVFSPTQNVMKSRQVVMSNDNISEYNEDSDDTNDSIRTKDKKKYKKLKSNFLDIKNYCDYWKTLHGYSAKFYEKKNKWLIFPSIIITSVGSLLSFFASSDSITNDERIKLTLAVGGIGTLSGILQALSNSLSLSKKAESHQSAMESYDLLLNKIRFHIIKGKYSEEENIKFLELIENDIMEIKKRFKYSIPDKIQKLIINNNYEKIKNTKLFEIKKEIIESELIDELRNTIKNKVKTDIENQLSKF
jgi:hypothetical protein